MTPQEFIKQAIRTESTKSPIVSGDLDQFRYALNRLTHVGFGLVTESGEFLDSLKKHLFYGKQLNGFNLGEEVGDILWYIAIYCDTTGRTFEQLFQSTIAKLKSRYPEKFSLEKSNFRDTKEEFRVMRELIDITTKPIQASSVPLELDEKDNCDICSVPLNNNVRYTNMSTGKHVCRHCYNKRIP